MSNECNYHHLDGNSDLKQKPKKLTKTCKVCGGQAYANKVFFNYSGLSCESCKSFFRRNAFKQEKFKCKLENNCQITVKTRKFCGHCRIKKCFEIGMRVDMFRAKSSTAKKPETNQQLQLESENNTNNFEDSETVVIQLPKTINYYEDCLNSFKTSVESLSSSPLTKRKHVLGEVNEVSHLTPANRKKGFVQQLVEYSQTLAGFSELNIEDKTTLLGESFSEVLLLRSAFNFNFERDSLVVLLDCEMNISVYTKLDVFYQKVNFFICLHRSLAYLVRELIQGDPLVRELTVVLLMLQHRQRLFSLELIGYLNAKYSLLLKLYLFEKFGEDDARVWHRQILQLIDRTGPLKKFIEKISSGVSQLPHREHFYQYIHSLMQ